MCTLISELTYDIEKPYYIGHKQGIKPKNAYRIWKMIFRCNQYHYNKLTNQPTHTTRKEQPNNAEKGSAM